MLMKSSDDYELMNNTGYKVCVYIYMYMQLLQCVYYT